MFQAVLSSTVLSLDGSYTVKTLDAAPDVAGVPHFVGHPSTKEVLNNAGAVYTPGLFAGLEPGQSFLASSLAQPRSGGQDATTQETEVTPADLTWRVVTRLD